MAFLLKTFGAEVGVYDSHVAAIEGACAFVAKQNAALEADGIRMAIPFAPPDKPEQWVYDAETGGSFTVDVLAVRRVFVRHGKDPRTVHAAFEIIPI